MYKIGANKDAKPLSRQRTKNNVGHVELPAQLRRRNSSMKNNSLPRKSTKRILEVEGQNQDEQLNERENKKNDDELMKGETKRTQEEKLEIKSDESLESTLKAPKRSIEVIHYLTDENAHRFKRYMKEGETHITDDEL